MDANQILDEILSELETVKGKLDTLTDFLMHIPIPSPNGADAPKVIEADNGVASASLEGDVF